MRESSSAKAADHLRAHKQVTLILGERAMLQPRQPNEPAVCLRSFSCTLCYTTRSVNSPWCCTTARSLRALRCAYPQVYETSQTHVRIEPDLVFDCVGQRPNSQYMVANLAKVRFRMGLAAFGTSSEQLADDFVPTSQHLDDRKQIVVNDSMQLVGLPHVFGVCSLLHAVIHAFAIT